MKYNVFTKEFDFNKTINQMALDNCIVRHLAGSHAYGTSTPTSDVDYRGIFIADPHFTFSPFHNVGTVEIAGEEDTVYQELGKYVQLLVDQNPNIIETLWVDESVIDFTTPEYELLRSHRESLLSSKAMYTYSGYAHGQLKRLQGHHKWLTMMEAGKIQIEQLYKGGILNSTELRNHFEGSILDDLNVPYVEPKGIEELGYEWVSIIDKLANYKEARVMCNIPFTEYEFMVLALNTTGNIPRHGYAAVKTPKMPNLYRLYKCHDAQVYDQRGAIVTNYSTEFINGLITHDESIDNPTDKVLHVYIETDVKKNTQERWEQYHTWRANRNVTRSQLEAAHGYDSKHASHLIRLLKSGLEILTTGQVNVKRPDAAELTDIRNGSLTLSELLEYANSLDEQVKQAYNNTTLRKSVDVNKAAKLVIDIRMMYLSR